MLKSLKDRSHWKVPTHKGLFQIIPFGLQVIAGFRSSSSDDPDDDDPNTYKMRTEAVRNVCLKIFLQRSIRS